MVYYSSFVLFQEKGELYLFSWCGNKMINVYSIMRVIISFD